LLEVGVDIRERYREQAALCSTGFLFEALNICSSCDVNYKISKNQRLHVELALLRLSEIGVEKKNVEPVAPAAQNKASTTTSEAAKFPVRPVLPSVSIKEAMAGHPEMKVTPVAEPKTALTENVSTTVVAAPPAKTGNQPITQEALTAAWNSFANAMKAEDTRIFSMLTAHVPNLAGETNIIFQISNPLQKEPLHQIQPRLLQHLRDALDNEDAEIEIVLAEKNETSKAYTAEDKFTQMSRKNPALMTFKQQFILDFE